MIAADSARTGDGSARGHSGRWDGAGATAAPTVPSDGAGACVLTGPQIARVLSALLQEEVLRTSDRNVSRSAIVAGDRLDEAGLGLDSLARLRAVATVTAYFDLASTGLEDYLVINPRLSAWTEIVQRHLVLRGPLAQVTFTTSGSSGLTPKRATHRLDDLIAEVDAVAAILRTAPHLPRRILSSAPPQHIYGFLFSVLMPDRLGCPVIDLSEKPPTAALRCAIDGDLIIGTPFTWQMAIDGGAMARGTCSGLVSTAPARADLWPRAQAAGVAPLTEIYGSSETSGVGWRQAPDAPFGLLPHLGRSGDVPTRGPAVLALQDRLVWSSPRHFSLAGRLDESVQVGGMNVSPAAVRTTLSRVRGVSDVAIRLDGERLKAFVVPESTSSGDMGALEQRLRRAAARTLAPPARPQRYTFGPEIPRTAMGKLADWPTGTRRKGAGTLTQAEPETRRGDGTANDPG